MATKQEIIDNLSQCGGLSYQWWINLLDSIFFDGDISDIYQKIDGTILPIPETNFSKISILGSGTFTQQNGDPIVVSEGSLAVVVFDPETETWSKQGSDIILPEPTGKDTLDPEGSGIPNEQAIAKYVEPIMSLLTDSVNLADNSKMIRGAYILDTGAHVGSDNSISLPKQKIKEGEEFISISGAGGLASSFARFTFYDEEGNYISGSRDSIGVAIPEGTSEFGVTVDNSTNVGLDPTNSPFKGTLMVNYGQSALPYEVFSKKINSTNIHNETFVEKTDLEIDKTFGAINSPTSSNNSFLVLNAPFVSSGKVDEITIRTPDTGVLKLVLLKKITSNYPNPVSGNKETFEVVSTFEHQIETAGINKLPFEINGEEGQYLGIDGRLEEVRTIARPSWQPSAQSKFGWWQKASADNFDLTFQPIDVNLTYRIKSNKYVTQEELNELKKEVKINRITATRNASNYNSIRDIVKGITDASEFNRYVIFVPKGEWFEVDLQGKDFVDIEGAHRDETILYCDGNDSTKTLPDDYRYVNERGKIISTVGLTYLHVVFGVGNSNYKNLTLRQTRGKYAAHLDDIAFSHITFENVRFKEDGGSSYPVGIGLRANQKLTFINPIFERAQNNAYSSIGRLGMFFHNTNNQSAGSEMNIYNPRYINCGYILVDELGSGQNDVVNIYNPSTNDIAQISFMVDVANGVSLYTDPVTGQKEPDPKKVPYCITVNVYGGRVDLVSDRSASNFNAPYNTGTQRPNWMEHLNSDYFGFAMVEEGVTITKGQLLAYGSTQPSSISVPVAKPFVGFSDSDILGVALEDSSNGQVRYVPRGKYAETLVNGVIGSGDLSKKIVWDDVNKYLKADPTADIRNIQGKSLNNKATGLGLATVKIK